MRARVNKSSQALRDYIDDHPMTPDIEMEYLETSSLKEDVLFVANKDNTDAYIILEVIEHPAGLKFWVCPNSNPDHITPPPMTEMGMVEVRPGVLGFAPGEFPVQPKNFYGQYVATVQEAVTTCRSWRDDKVPIPKDYNRPTVL